MYLRILAIFVIIASAGLATIAAPGDEVPAWLLQAAAAKVPSYDKDVPAVVLHKEQTLTMDSDGRLTTTTMFAVRVLLREGRAFASANQLYLTNSGKVKELRAWLISSGGTVKKYGKDSVIDIISDPNDIYNEYRVKIINGAEDADAGSVFGYEAISEEHPLFTQDVWLFQSRLPTLLSRYTLNLPAGWRANSVTFNYQKVEPSVNGSSYTWELRSLQPIRTETASPEVRNLAPRIAINYFLPESVPSSGFRNFETWTDVSRWATQLHDPQAIPDENITTKAKQLTANAANEFEKIRAIAHFVQRLQYISIDIGIGKGNGYKPHAATQVLAKAYGDCKDKANLMRAMLKAIGIEAYPILIYSGDATFVTEDWPSPGQFNHCIIAVKVGDETKAETVIIHPTLGRLLVFDATDEHTPVGDLPDDEQGSLALIVAGDQGTLSRMPMMAPQSSLLQREADVLLTPDGAITATIKERSTGQTAVDERRLFRNLSTGGYKHMIEAWVTRGASTARVSRVDPSDDDVAGRFALDVEFSALGYGQLMQNRLLVFNPAIVSRREGLFLTESTRQYPILLESHAFSEKVRVKLPDGFQVDEVPDPVQLETTFGSYKTSYEVKDGELVFVRTMAQRGTAIPAAQYQTVRSFYEKIRAAELAPVVLTRK
jgi:transglutaminase-like putative cysteine protease